ncbi:ribbon-helix-helix domain-containing protein [Caldifermentibacillus hisashii]|uniref:ribbon-helix-helix domain-containing protein n=1 Tax=Caldifermentibacillus hisashii TaxID=996558 RepID=UPI0033696C05
MKFAGEIVQHLNETGANVYELSERLGLSRTTLRARLIKLGYEVNGEGLWNYKGNPEDEPYNVDIVSINRLISKKQSSNAVATTRKDALNTRPNIHDALMQLDLQEKGIRTTISIQPAYLEGIKELAAKTRLRLSDLYTLAIYELLEKYQTND